VGITARYAVLVLFTIAVLVPFVSIVLAALQPQDTPISGLNIPDQLTWSNFAEAWSQGHFNRLVLSSVIIAAIVVPLTVVLATLAGFSLALLRPPGARGISLAFVLGLTLPVELVVVAPVLQPAPPGIDQLLPRRGPGRIGTLPAVRGVLDADPLHRHPP